MSEPIPQNPIPPSTAQVVDDPAKPWKAAAATAVSAIGAFIAFWVADEDPFTAKDAGSALLAALVASGIVGGATFVTPNPKTVADDPPRRKRVQK